MTLYRCCYSLLQPRSKPLYRLAQISFIPCTSEGITDTNTKKRDGFNRMIEDAVNGKIDLILTKSVSRFARNTVESILHNEKCKGAALLQKCFTVDFLTKKKKTE